MNSKLIGFMMFVLGAAVGSAVTLKYVREKYEQIAQEEIDSVKEAFSKRESEDQENRPAEKTQVRIRAEQAKDKPSVAEYARSSVKRAIRITQIRGTFLMRMRNPTVTKMRRMKSL